MSIFVLNIATMLGLALAIDYSLFIVSRYREELRRGRTVGEAVERAVGDRRQGRRVQRDRGRDRAVRPAAVRGPGHPLDRHRRRARRALLGRLRADLPAGRPRDARPSRQRAVAQRAAPPLPPGRRRRRGRADRRAGSASRTRVMRRPIAVLDPDPRLPAHRRQPVPAPRAGRARRRDLPARRREPRRVRRAPDRVRPRRDDADHHPRRRRPARRPTSPTSRRSTPTPRSVDALEGIDRVESPFTIHDPATGALLTPEQVAALYALPAGQRPPGLDALLAQYVRGSTVRLDAISPLPPSRPEATDLIPVRSARSRRATGITTQVGGSAASGHDFLVSQAERAPYAVGLTLLASGLILFLLFGSVVIPIKAVHHDPAVDHRQLRGDGLDLPGGQPVRTCSTSSRSGTPSRATRSSCSASSSGCRWTTRSCSCRGSRRPTGGPATTPRRSPRACRRRPASSPARR